MNHTFDVDIATQYGVNAAIVFQDMGFWCEHSRINRKNYHDGLYWTFNSISALGEHYPYMSSKAIRGAIQKLVDAGLLVTGNFNKLAFDRTMWYALTDEGSRLFLNGKLDFPKKENDNFPKGKMTTSQKGEPIPDTLPDTLPDNKSTRKRGTFTPPTVEEVQEYAASMGYSPAEFSPSGFVDFYQSKGWKVGKSTMKDWKAAARGWVSRYRQDHPAVEENVERDLSVEEVMRMNDDCSVPEGFTPIGGW